MNLMCFYFFILDTNVSPLVVPLMCCIHLWEWGSDVATDLWLINPRRHNKLTPAYLAMQQPCHNMCVTAPQGERGDETPEGPGPDSHATTAALTADRHDCSWQVASWHKHNLNNWLKRKMWREGDIFI